jgi:hypothetical protein
MTGARPDPGTIHPFEGGDTALPIWTAGGSGDGSAESTEQRVRRDQRERPAHRVVRGPSGSTGATGSGPVGSTGARGATGVTGSRDHGSTGPPELVREPLSTGPMSYWSGRTGRWSHRPSGCQALRGSYRSSGSDWFAGATGTLEPQEPLEQQEPRVRERQTSGFCRRYWVGRLAGATGVQGQPVSPERPDPVRPSADDSAHRHAGDLWYDSDDNLLTSPAAPGSASRRSRPLWRPQVPASGSYADIGGSLGPVVSIQTGTKALSPSGPTPTAGRQRGVRASQ